ncbi:MAG: glucose-1-phosphate adenylyltransferase [Desulfarculales bacterium]|jgi:glucose-1-phosphate adenylyltransferase|nr:glucose-1-phosphate adenylyltransferase [Desulfarculales bacterium]
MKNVLAIIMAGGKGERLYPLTKDRSKPSVPFGGTYRLIDLTLSNCVNSGIYKILVLPQYKSQSLVEHLEAGWNIFSYDLGHYLRIVSPQMRTGQHWYQGTADSVRQNSYLLRELNIEEVLILSGDHVYKMDYSNFFRFHRQHDADVSISVIEVNRADASQYGVAEVDGNNKIKMFHEKPANPVGIPGDDEHSLASMGIYIFKREVLLDALSKEGTDFGHHVIPYVLENYKVKAYPYRANNKIADYVITTDEYGKRYRVMTEQTKDSGYWRDVGTLDSYWNANMDLCGVDPYYSLYGEMWPIHTYMRQFPPAKFIFQAESGARPRVGKALESLVGQGCIISGLVRNSVLGANITVRSWSEVSESVILDDVTIDRDCQIHKAIIDKRNHIPYGTSIGMDPSEDRKFFTVTERGITVVPKGYFPLWE